MTEEQKKHNFELYASKLSQLGVDTEQLTEKYGALLTEGSFTNSGAYAYPGSLIEVVLKVLTPYAVRINELLPDSVRVDKDTLVKACLLHHIGKAVRLVKNDNNWEVHNRGLAYKYNKDVPSIRTGLHSVAMCIECGIPLTTDEVEVVTVNDRDLTDNQSRYHSSVMSTIVRQANELTYTQLNNTANDKQQ